MPQSVRTLYTEIIDAWNERDGEAMARPFAADGTVIGFDGSVHSGRENISEQMGAVFRDHPTARYVTRVDVVRALGPDVELLRATAGLVPPGTGQVKPEVNAHHTVVAERRDGRWQIVLYQNTPAQFHGRPELVERMTRELQEIADRA